MSPGLYPNFDIRPIGFPTVNSARFVWFDCRFLQCNFFGTGFRSDDSLTVIEHSNAKFWGNDVLVGILIDL